MALDRSIEQAAADREQTLLQLHGILVEQVSSLESVDAWQAWLRFANGFHRYSFNNTLLIWAQCPQATAVAGYRAWQALGRQVRKGEKAIKVLGPVTRKVTRQDANGNPVRDGDGQPVLALQMVGVKPVSVFDVSMTEGAALPEPPQPQLLVGEAPPGLWESLEALIAEQGFRVTRGDCGTANGVTMYDTREVRVRSDVDDAQSVRTLCHEAAHVLLHSDRHSLASACRGRVEVEAESVAYLVTSSHQMDPAQYSFTYVAGWAHDAARTTGDDVASIVQATGQRVIETANRILQATVPPPEPSQAGAAAHARELQRELEPASRPVPTRHPQPPTTPTNQPTAQLGQHHRVGAPR